VGVAWVGLVEKREEEGGERVGQENNEEVIVEAISKKVLMSE